MTTDWAAWSRESVALAAARTEALMIRLGIAADAPYQWDLDRGELTLGGHGFELVPVGTVEGDSFLWAWANDALRGAARGGARVRRSAPGTTSGC
jgi:hypothetical protein